MPHTLILHVGLQKTGTTHLQTKVFPRHPAFHGHHGTTSEIHFKELADLSKLMGFKDPNSWEEENPVTLWTRCLADTLIGAPEVLFSYENLVRQPNLLEDMPNLERNARWRPGAHLARFIKALAPDSRSTTILMTIRRQPEFLASLYAQYSKRFSNPSQEDFEAKVERIINAGPRLGGRILDYAGLVADLESENPSARVLLYPLEKMQSPGYFASLGKELGIELHSPADYAELKPTYRRSEGNTWGLRTAKSAPLWPHFPAKPRKIRLNLGLTEKIMASCRDSNRLLETKNLPIGLPGSYL